MILKILLNIKSHLKYILDLNIYCKCILKQAQVRTFYIIPNNKSHIKFLTHTQTLPPNKPYKKDYFREIKTSKIQLSIKKNMTKRLVTDQSKYIQISSLYIASNFNYRDVDIPSTKIMIFPKKK